MHCSIVNINLSAKLEFVFRLIALALCFSIIFVFLLSTAFISIKSNHAHDSNGINGSCATCCQISTAEALLKQFSTAIIFSSFIIKIYFFIPFLIKYITFRIRFFTPVTLKIRMNN